MSSNGRPSRVGREGDLTQKLMCALESRGEALASASQRIEDLRRGRRGPVRVLLVDDDAPLARSLKADVEAAVGLRVDLAFSVEEALHMARQADYGVIVVDLVLPDGDGIDLIRALRQGSAPLASIVIMSGAVSAFDVETARQGTGSVESLHKSNRHELAGIVRKLTRP